MSERRAQIHTAHGLTKTRRCALLEVARSTAYYQEAPVAAEDLELMRHIDEIHLRLPFLGSRRIVDELETLGFEVNRKRVQRLMRRMGLQALYPRRRTSQPGAGHTVYPYLLRGLSIERPNQVWAADVSYLPMAKGVHVPGGHHGLALAAGAVLAGVQYPGAGVLRGGAGGGLGPPWHPGDLQYGPGAQFTAKAFTGVLKAHQVAISMDGKGRWMDNVFIERLWRSVKYEDVYLRAYETPAQLRAGLSRHFEYYNARRRHSALDRRTPDAVYFAQAAPVKAA